MLARNLQINLSRQIERRYDVKVRRIRLKAKNPDEEFLAQTLATENVIELNVRAPANFISRDAFLSTLLHEVAHILAVREGKFKVFHELCVENASDKHLLIYMRSAYNAEVWVEKRAAQLLQEFSPGSTYWYSYSLGKLDTNKLRRDKNWMRLVFCADVKKELRRRKLKRIDKEKRNERQAS